MLFGLLLTLLVKNDLSSDLFTNYSKEIRPVIYINESVHMKMGLTINSLEYFDQKAEKIKLNMEVHMDWYDDYLKWDTTKDETPIVRLLCQIIKYGCQIWNSIIQPQIQRNMNQLIVFSYIQMAIFFLINPLFIHFRVH